MHPEENADIPPEAGHRRTIAPNGEVHGSGAGAGGGNPGEDYDNDEHGGDRRGEPGTGYGVTGVGEKAATAAQGAGDRK